MSAPLSTPPTAAPVKRAAQIAQCIEADIIRRGWPVGQSLGSEDELRQRYRASRSVLREAVRLVEHHRVARMRRGPGGGLFVSAPDAVPAAAAAAIYLDHCAITVDDLLDARAVLEPLAAARAATRELSKNPVLQLFIDVLMRLSERYGNDGHEAEPTAETWQPKRAETLATTIADDIATSGLPPSSLFATEAELLDRYAVSRSVLREAVRLLEYHRLAQTRRGPGGGLLVNEPGAQPSIDTFALYLEYRKPSREELRVVRDAIEIDNVGKAVARRDTPAVRAFIATHRSPVDADQAESSFHTGLAQLAGNPVLELFLRLLAELLGRHWTPPDNTAEHAHRNIIEAIADGDDTRARQHARRHLATLTSWCC